MDYLEGALLGKLWSDTDFENRPHRGAAVLLSLAVWVAFTGFVLVSNLGYDISGQLRQPRFWITLTVILILASSPLSFYYYKFPAIGRILILLMQMVKFAGACMYPISLFVPRIVVNTETLIGDVMAWLDNTVGSYIERSTETNELFGLVWSGLMTVLGGVLIFLLFVAAIVLLPILYLQLIRLLQWVVDQIFLAVVRPLRIMWHDYRQKHPQVGTGSAFSRIWQRTGGEADSPANSLTPQPVEADRDGSSRKPATPLPSAGRMAQMQDAPDGETMIRRLEEKRVKDSDSRD